MKGYAIRSVGKEEVWAVHLPTLETALEGARAAREAGLEDAVIIDEDTGHLVDEQPYRVGAESPVLD